MKKKVFNPTNATVNITVSGVRVIIPAGESELVDYSVGSALQDIQPQLHYSEVDDKLVKEDEKRATKKLKVENEELEASEAKVKKLTPKKNEKK